MRLSSDGNLRGLYTGPMRARSPNSNRQRSPGPPLALWGLSIAIHNPSLCRSGNETSSPVAPLERGCHVLELGAGAGLPGVMCALHGARTVVLSDYGSEFDRGLVKAMDLNIATFATAGCSLHSVPYIWGKSVDPLLVSSLVTATDADAGAGAIAGAGAGASDDAANIGVNKLFDVVIMADCIFNRSEHKQLCWTLVHTLDKSNPRAVCICSFSHHDPQYMKEDLNFLELVREAGLQCTLVGEEKRKSYPFVEDDGMDEKRGWVYIWAIKWAVPAEIEEGGP